MLFVTMITFALALAILISLVKLPKTSANEEVIRDLKLENMAVRRDLSRVKDRIHTLERIITDPDEGLKRDIGRL